MQVFSSISTLFFEIQSLSGPRAQWFGQTGQPASPITSIPVLQHWVTDLYHYTELFTQVLGCQSQVLMLIQQKFYPQRGSPHPKKQNKLTISSLCSWKPKCSKTAIPGKCWLYKLDYHKVTNNTTSCQNISPQKIK